MSQESGYPKSIAAASISRAAAAALVNATLAAAKDIGIEVSVAVTDVAGHLKAFERSDRAPFLTIDVAIDKAWTAASFGYPTHGWANLIASDEKLAQLAHRPRLVAVGGGYPIIESGKLIGGIGISGGSYKQDQDAAVVALGALGFEVRQ